jgi:membrane fusion protein (multidrug efflux system)
VDSFSPASGNQFALLPADNATGNFTKIVQRVPVKITFRPEDLKKYAGRLVPGMSTVVEVDLRQNTKH